MVPDPDCVDPPTGPLPPHRHLVLDRGPYTIPGERALVQGHGIDALVTKDSGGTYTAAKLAVARELGLPVVVVRRPPRPPAPAATNVAEALDLLDQAG